MKRKNFKFVVGDRVSLTKKPNAMGTITELVGLEVPLYLIRWDDTPKQLLISFEHEIAQ